MPIRLYTPASGDAGGSSGGRVAYQYDGKRVTFANAVSATDTTMTVDDASFVEVGDRWDTDNKVTDVTGNVITLESACGVDYAVDATADFVFMAGASDTRVIPEIPSISSIFFWGQIGTQPYSSFAQRVADNKYLYTASGASAIAVGGSLHPVGDATDVVGYATNTYFTAHGALIYDISTRKLSWDSSHTFVGASTPYIWSIIIMSY